MGSLGEIESAVDRLPLEDQETLLRLIEAKVRQRKRAIESDPEQWMGRLESLRKSIDSGRRTVTTDQILGESREERN
jgi:hypothetical protein